MVDKRISDLEVTTDLQDTTLFHVRKTETNEDFKITKANLVKQIGNSVVSGFNATSPSANRILLTPSNSGSLDQYYNGMTIKFISPINSTDLVKIKIGSLGYIDFKTTFTNPITNVVENGVLKTGKFYEAIYTNNSFIQTNIDRQYTNEYLSIGEIIFDNVTQEYFTLYTLTSATSYYKTQYYEGMSIVFTSGIIANSVENMSNGKIYIDVDGLGVKLLSDPDGDGVPFSLQPNETILGIYDGEKFIKNMFSMQEPELPVPIDPNNPPPGYDITVYVGPNEPEVSNRLLQTAYDRIVKDYGSGGGGRRVLIKFRDNYTGQGLKVFQKIPTNSGFWYRKQDCGFITIEGNPNCTMLPHQSKLSIFDMSDGDSGFSLFESSIPPIFTGSWKTNFPITDSIFKSNYSVFKCENATSFYVQIIIVNAFFININQGNQNYTCFNFKGALGKVIIINSEFINFGQVFTPPVKNDFSDGIRILEARNVTITNTINATRSFSSLFEMNFSQATIINLNLNITKPSNYTNIILLNRGDIEISDTNIEISEPTQSQIFYCNLFYTGVNGIRGKNNITINNSNIKYSINVSNTKGSLYYKGSNIDSLPSGYLNGNNYVNTNSVTIPDIIVDGAILSLKSGTLGSTQTINGGSIVNV
jgi:hypothetical protein